MNTLLLDHLKQTLPTYPGNYCEIGSFDGTMLSILANQFPNKKFTCIDNNNYKSIMDNIIRYNHVNFFNSSVTEFYQCLTNTVAVSYSIDTMVINYAKNYSDYAESTKLIVKLLGVEPGQVYFAQTQTKLVQSAIEEFELQLGHRIIHSQKLDQDLTWFTIREQ